MEKIQKTAWVERQANGKVQKHMWHFARSVQQEVVFASCSCKGWKVDLFWESQAQTIMSKLRRTIHIDRKTESLWQKYDVLCLVGPGGHWPRTWIVLRFVRKREKMARWTVRSKGGRFLQAWYSQITRKMGKIYNKRWSKIWIKYFLSFLQIWRILLGKNRHLILVNLVLTSRYMHIVFLVWRRLN